MSGAEKKNILLKGDRLKKIDMWNVGIIMFEHLLGKTCQESLETVEKLEDLEDLSNFGEDIAKKRPWLKWVKNSERIFKALSSNPSILVADGLEIVKHLLKHKDEERWDSDKVLKHAWLARLNEHEREVAFKAVLAETMTGKRESGSLAEKTTETSNKK